MKLKFLLFLFLFAGILNAQEDTIRTLIISEAHLGAPGRNYVEISNVGNEPIQLSKFEFGRHGNNTFAGTPATTMRLPERLLQPGESFVIAEVNDFSGANALALGLENYKNPPLSELAQIADIQIHRSNYDFNNNQLRISQEFAKFDSISEKSTLLDMYFGRQAYYLEQHFENGDSAVVDQVMGVFDTETATEGVLSNKSMAVEADGYDVAGYPSAGTFANLIRKYSVKQGNLEFVRGNAEDDSEWIALPTRNNNNNRLQPWTYGNHGDYKLDENTLESDIIGVDFGSKVLTVPWGIRKPDDIMRNMVKKPGIDWIYHLSPLSADSLTWGSRTGDKLEVIVVGTEAYRAVFDIVVEDPTPSDNMVIPMMNKIAGSNYAATIFSGAMGWPWVTRNENGIDTITGTGTSIVNRGLPYSLRVDTLLKVLEKPANANWEILPVDGNTTRPDLVDGDKLKVTAQDGSTKEYYIQIQRNVGNNVATLATITWPDIPDPEYYEIVYQWKGDTIPYFMPTGTNYQVKLTSDIESIPATVAKPTNVNATVETKRATLFNGTQEERTTTYTVTATDDTTQLVYNVEWQREEKPENIQPYSAEPFVSEYVMREHFGNNYLEICNPGNQPLDLSDYMIVGYPSTNPAEAITFNPETWNQRYRKYVPGYKWVDEATWPNRPGYLVPDIAVNPIVQPGDVFCLGSIVNPSGIGYGNTGWSHTSWPGLWESDVQFNIRANWSNPWNEDVNSGYTPVAIGYSGHSQWIFKILNDSVKQGLKPATDPNDFELIEAMGEADGTSWLFGNATTDDGHNYTRFYRKPHINKPNPVLGASFGESPAESEWVRVTRFSPGAVGGWPNQWIVTAIMDYGKHYFIPSSDFLSTVTSRVYKVSEGYGDPLPESIRGLVTGVTVGTFFGNITKKHEDQTLVVKSMVGGSELAMDGVISLNDTLVVTSADGTNQTKYLLEVSETGLSSNALLTSTLYTINVDVQPKSASNENAGWGTVSGFEYGTQLRTLLANVTVPDGARLTVIDENGGFVPLKRLNFDTVYVNVTVNTTTLLEVVAEDGVTVINYQLQPSTSANAAFITSDYFNVIQTIRLVEFVPGGISVSSLLGKLSPSAGATMKIVDKSGLDRTTGGINLDDKIVVTSPNGLVTNVYHISVLTTQSMPVITYLAYVTSNIYLVDQVSYIIQGPTVETALSEFYGRINPVMGATAVVVDANGNEKTSGDLISGDKLKVTSADGKMEVMYTIDLSVTSNLVDSGNIMLYPNPTSGRINISGVNSGNRIQVFNSMGAAVSEIHTQRNIETISLDEQPAGMYLIVISHQNKVLGRFKVMRR